MAVSCRRNYFFCLKLLKPLKLKLRGTVTKYVPGSAGSVVIQLSLRQFIKQKGCKRMQFPKDDKFIENTKE